MRRSGSARTSPTAKNDSTAPSVCAILLLLVTGQAHGQQTALNANGFGVQCSQHQRRLKSYRDPVCFAAQAVFRKKHT